MEAIVDGARYDNRDPKLDIATLDEVCTTYFLKPTNAPTQATMMLRSGQRIDLHDQRRASGEE